MGFLFDGLPREHFIGAENAVTSLAILLSEKIYEAISEAEFV